MRDSDVGTGCITRALVGLAVLSILVSLGGCAASRSRVELSDGFQAREVVEPDAGRVAESLEHLLASCSVDSTGWAASEDTWQKALSGPYILATTAEHRVLSESVPLSQVAGRLVSWEEILLPLPPGTWPDHILVRDAQSIFAFTKYRPERLAALVLDDRLGLARRPQCEWLCEELQKVGPR